MEIELTSTKDNRLLDRREICFEVQVAATPKRVEVRNKLATMLSTDLDRVWVRKMETKSGTRRTVGLVHVYNEAADPLKIEPKHIIKRNQAPNVSKSETSKV
jgi:ribosomal protein S24E